MNEDERIAIWLDALLKVEMDLRPSRGVAKEARLGPKTPRVLILEDGEMAGYAELRRVERPMYCIAHWRNRVGKTPLLNWQIRDLHVADQKF